MAEHRRAVERGDLGYMDPGTGLFVMTAPALWERGGCCGQGCRHCPFVGRHGNTSAARPVGTAMLVEIWSDVVCPWCYIGKRRFEAALTQFDHGDDVQVRWRSFELDPRAPFRRSGNMVSHLAAKYGMSTEQASSQVASLDALGRAEGLSFDLAGTQGGNTFDAHRLIHLAYTQDPETGAALKEALLHAYFVELRPISEPDVLEEIATSAGLDPTETRDLLAGDRFGAEVRADEAEARELGATGVPFFVVNRSFAVPGAQDVETFLRVLEKAWDRSQAAAG